MTFLFISESLILAGCFWWWLQSRASFMTLTNLDPATLDAIIARLTTILDLLTKIKALETDPVVGIVPKLDPPQ